MDHPLAVYLPVDRCHALATGTPLLERTQGAALFADISGFTPLTEALTRELGTRRGAEELPRQLNRVYDALIREVDRYGGSVIGFAGDAITCWFEGDSGLRATACALAMQQTMQTFATIPLPSGSTAALAMKVAVAAGAVRRFLVGDPHVQLLDVLAGATLARMAAAEHVAEKGEVVLDEASTHALGELLEIQSWRMDEQGAPFAIVAGLRGTVSPQPWQALAPGSLSVDMLRPWLLPTIFERLQAGQGEFLTELRPAVALFLRFDGIDYDGDPEAGQKLDEYIRWVQRVLAQYEGTLVQLTIGEKGSYLYAAFGAPIAHEDDARRAALTALVLRTPPEVLTFITETQIGLTRGTMRTGAYGGSTRRTYGSLGDEVNLAARLMQHARAGQIIASGRVYSATETLFVWQPLAEIRVKGKMNPIPIFALLGEAQVSTIHLTEPAYILPMIGRQAELAVLAEKVALARRGQGQIVGITAEAGMGKSRLVAEVIRLAQGQGFTGYGGECQSYGTNTPYLVWQPIWRAFFGLDASATPDEQTAELAHAISDLDAALLPRLPLLAPVLGLPLADNELTRPFSPELRKNSREALLVDLVKVRARRLGEQQGALLLVLEDCHWLDGASHDLLEAIGYAIRELPVLLLLAYRPPDLERLAAPRVSSLAYFTLLPLLELSEAEATHLITSRLAHLYPQETREPPELLVRQLAERAQGNPFCLEELVNYLHDQGNSPFEAEGVTHADLPTSLHALILSRIDRLTESQKVTLKVASIIGRLFRLQWLLGYYPTLGEASEVRRDLDALSRLNLTPLEEPEPELAYLFKHIVTREVAYESLAYATRARLHEQFARFVEQQEPTEVQGYLDLVAYHYTLSENRPKAREYLRRAGEAAQAAYANITALDHYERLLALLETDTERLEVKLHLGAILLRVGRAPEAEAYYQAALTLAQQHGAAEGVAQSQQGLGAAVVRRGYFEDALQHLKQAQASWMALDNLRAVSQVLVEQGVALQRQGAFAEAETILMEGLALAKTHNARGEMAIALNALGNLAYFMGNYHGAGTWYQQSLSLYREAEDQVGILVPLINLGRVAGRVGRWSQAQTILEEGLVQAQKLGLRLSVSWCLYFMAWLAHSQGDNEAARSLHEEALLVRQELGDRWGIALSLSAMGAVDYIEGHLEEARTRLQESLTLSQELGDKRSIAHALNYLGFLAQAQGEATAWTFHRESLALALTIGDQPHVTSNLMGMAALLVDRTPSDLLAALRLVTAAKRIHVASGEVPEPACQRAYEHVMTTIPEEDKATYMAAWAEGEAMSLDEAVALALAISEEDSG